MGTQRKMAANKALAQPLLVTDELTSVVQEDDDGDVAITSGHCPRCGREVVRSIHGYGSCLCGQVLIGRDDQGLAVGSLPARN